MRITPGSSASSPVVADDAAGAGCDEMTPVSIVGAAAGAAAGVNHSGVPDMVRLVKSTTNKGRTEC